MARALITQPRLLLLDEPQRSLDLQSSQVLESIIAELSDVQIILVTHSLAQAKRLANEVVFMHRGRLLEQTSAEQFFDRPTTKKHRAMWHWNAGKAVIAYALAWPALAETLILQSATSPETAAGLIRYCPSLSRPWNSTFVIAVGSGQALKNAQRCDGDLLLTHAPAAEIRFLKRALGNLGSP